MLITVTTGIAGVKLIQDDRLLIATLFHPQPFRSKGTGTGDTNHKNVVIVVTMLPKPVTNLLLEGKLSLPSSAAHSHPRPIRRYSE